MHHFYTGLECFTCLNINKVHVLSPIQIQSEMIQLSQQTSTLPHLTGKNISNAVTNHGTSLVQTISIP